MNGADASQAYRGLSLLEREGLFLDILTAPSFLDRSGWGAHFFGWLEEQAADGRSLGEIARRIDLPGDLDPGNPGSWRLLDDHIAWMIERGHARVVRIEIVA